MLRKDVALFYQYNDLRPFILALSIYEDTFNHFRGTLATVAARSSRIPLLRALAESCKREGLQPFPVLP